MQRDTKQTRGSLLDNLSVIWVCVFYLTLGMCAALMINQRRTALTTSESLILIALIAAASWLFQYLFLPTFTDVETRWPLPYRRALIYFTAQAIVLIFLLHIDASFVGVGFAITGQVFGSLRPAQWPAPMLAIFALIAQPIGIYSAVIEGHWPMLIGIVIIVSLWLLFAVLMYMLFDQRYRLLSTVRELDLAKAEIEASMIHKEELAILRERARLARDMHDSLGHRLVSIKIKLEAAQRIYARDPQKGDQQLDEVCVMVREGMSELRETLGDLRKQPAANGELQRLLAEKACLITEAGLPTRLTIAPDIPLLPMSASTILWRITCEALHNIQKHANAHNVALMLTVRENTLVYQITDDGKGIDPADLARPGHYGIIGMREQIKALDGTLRVYRRPEGGTCVEAIIPLGV
jgi:signal transduction histidine kinase